MNEMEAVTNMALFLKQNLPSANIFKFKKPVNFSDEYICVNSQPIMYGKTINTSGTLNINIHVPDNPDESPNSERLNTFASDVDALIPHKNDDIEDFTGLILGRFEFVLRNGSNCLEDNDNTHFINLCVNYTFIDK